MEDEKYIEGEVYGTISVQDATYFLLEPFPIRERDSWMRENTDMFKVAVDEGKPFIIVIRGDFLISYALEGATIKVRKANTQKGD